MYIIFSILALTVPIILGIVGAFETWHGRLPRWIASLFVGATAFFGAVETFAWMEQQLFPEEVAKGLKDR